MNASDSDAFQYGCVKDLKAGDKVLQFFELRSKEVRKTRSGQTYLDLVVGDATGALPVKMWSDSIQKWGQDFNPGDIVKIEGRVEMYRDRPQIVVDKIRGAQLSEVPDQSLLIRSTPYDPEELLGELRRIAAALSPTQMAHLVDTILDEHQEALKTFPAARMIHHAYKGGLIEHMVSVTRKVEAVLRVEKTVNRGLAIAGAILHDIGKIRELNPANRGRTPEGRLIGHVILGMELVRETATRLGLVREPWLRDLEHILLSHHGETEFGAPVRPFTREALVVHFIDNLDSKLKILEEALESVEPDGFTPYNKWLEGRAFAGTPPLAEEE